MSKLPFILNDILETLRKKKNFDPQFWISEKVDKLNTYMMRAGLNSCVVSISGGIDSAVTYLLAIESR